MAEEKTYTELIDQARAQSDFDFPFKVHSPAKYKKHPTDAPEFRQFHGVEIQSGTRIICEIHEGQETIGYALCTILDFQDRKGFWESTTDFIVEVTEVSRDELFCVVGRLRTVNAGQAWNRSGYILKEIGKANWDKYKVNETTQ